MGQALRNIIYLLLFIVFILIAMTTKPYSIGRGVCTEKCVVVEYTPIRMEAIAEAIRSTHSPLELIIRTLAS